MGGGGGLLGAQLRRGLRGWNGGTGRRDSDGCFGGAVEWRVCRSGCMDWGETGKDENSCLN